MLGEQADTATQSMKALVGTERVQLWFHADIAQLIADSDSHVQAVNHPPEPRSVGRSRPFRNEITAQLAGGDPGTPTGSPAEIARYLSAGSKSMAAAVALMPS